MPVNNVEASVWVDGVSGSNFPVTDRGLAYGDGLFETIKIVSGRSTLLDLHCQRLSEGAARLGISVDLDTLTDEIDRFLMQQNSTTGVLKVILTRGSGGRGYNPVGCTSPRRIISLHPQPDYPSEPALNGIRLYNCQTRMGETVLAGLKHLNRLENVLARAEWQDTQSLEGLVRDFDGRLIEGTMSNLFIVKNNRLMTPVLDRCGVKGVCREYILQESSLWGMKVNQTDLWKDDLRQADEVFVCNSVNGVWPVTGCEEMQWSIGAVTRTIQERVLDGLNA